MAKTNHADDSGNHIGDDAHYARRLRALQIELVKLQRALIKDGARVLVLMEGRDGAGKDGSIKRLTEHMSPRDTRIYAPGVPSNKEQTQWYFQRFVPFLPAAGEFVVFNRSWYNRSGVERVMGYCTKSDVREFLESVVPFEQMLVRDGIALRKFYLDISKREQKRRLEARRQDPLKQWKTSPVDEAAQKKWHAYSKARDQTLAHTSHAQAPWQIVRADVKKTARLEIIRALLESFDYPGKSRTLAHTDDKIVFPWSKSAHKKLAV